MQDVSFVIRKGEQIGWIPVIEEIEKHGYEVMFQPQDSDINFVLSGLYVNPLAIPHKRVLICHPFEWTKAFSVLYKPILEEYYDELIILDKLPLDRLMERIGGIIETSKSRSED